jgi:phosphodiesterase/alkaline phosphatase D-like protein
MKNPHRLFGPLIIFIWLSLQPFAVASNSSANQSGPIAEWIWIGGVSENRATAVAKLGQESAGLLISRNEDLVDHLRIEPTSSEQVPDGWIARFEIEGLSENTLFHYTIEGGEGTGPEFSGVFQTFPSGRAPLLVAVASCATTGSNHPVFDAIRSLNPHFYLNTGDLHYEDIAINDTALFYEAYSRVLNSHRQSLLYRSTPIAYIWDDHDYGPNNSDRTSPSRPAALESYQVAVPHYPLVCENKDAIYQAFSFGKIRFIMTDNRSLRPPRSVRDGPERSMLGAAQKEWFFKELKNSSQTHDLVVWVNSVPWIGDDGSYDNWAGFTFERREIANFIEQHGIKNLCVLSGDAHMVAIDDGSNNRYSDSGEPLFPVLQAAALHRRGSVKGGPYSHGTFPGHGQFGVLRVEYPDDETIRVTLSGHNEEMETLTEYSFDLSLAPIN